MSVRETVASKMLEDKETRKALAESIKSGANATKTAFKYVGIVALCGIAGFGIYKVTKLILDRRVANNELDKQTEGINKSNVHLSDAELVNMANSIYQAMDTTAYFKATANIQEDSIRRTLSLLTNEDEWKALQKTFGNRDGGVYDKGKMHNLVWFLQQDDDKDRQSYQAILDKIGVTNALGNLGKLKFGKKLKKVLKKSLNPKYALNPTKLVK